ncbi:MAG: peptidoglycan editing factor PgeF [Gammaproteobacteria bacterium]|nr:peptidoglycan editing factor PgeF [Gammaproteobacteria bacterium]
MNPEQPAWWLAAQWPAPPGIRAGITSRRGGASGAPFDSFNLALHVGDAEQTVRENRRGLAAQLGLGQEPAWLKQSHGSRLVDAGQGALNAEADAAYTRRPGLACGVLTADCIPLLLADRAGTEVAAVHIGWRGLASNIARNALHSFGHSPPELLAWIGPHISAARYDVHDDVRDACLRAAPDAEEAFVPTGRSAWRADLGRILRCQLRDCGLHEIHADGRCTFLERNLFYSYRRDGRTGRMASLIWIEKR